MAGTCEVPTPATIFAIKSFLRLALFFAAVSFDAPATPDHHVAVFLLRHARHAGGEILEGAPVRRAEFGQMINVRALLQHPDPVPLHHAATLLGGQGVSVQIHFFVGHKRLAVLGFQQRREKHIQVQSLAAPLAGEHVGSGNVFKFFPGRVHASQLFGVAQANHGPVRMRKRAASFGPPSSMAGSARTVTNSVTPSPLGTGAPADSVWPTPDNHSARSLETSTS